MYADQIEADADDSQSFGTNSDSDNGRNNDDIRPRLNFLPGKNMSVR